MAASNGGETSNGRWSTIQRIMNRSNVLRDQRIALRDKNDPPAYDVIALDFEASGFGVRTYPIEVGVCAISNGAEICSFSSLIKPTQQWRDQGIWKPESEAIHGLKHADLTSGLEPWQVCEVLDTMFADEVIVADGGIYDIYWLTRLYEGRKPAFSLRAGNDIPYRKLAEIRDKGVTAHRALPDARWLAHAMIAVENENTEEGVPDAI